MIPRAATLARRAKVGQWWMKGFSEREITDLIRNDRTLRFCDKCTNHTVHDDIVKVRDAITKEMDRSIEDCRNEAVARLRMVQRQAWIEYGKKGDILNRNAKAALLRVVVECEEKISKLEGTQAAVDLNLRGKDGAPLIPTALVLEFPEGTVIRDSKDGGNGHKSESGLNGLTQASP